MTEVAEDQFASIPCGECGEPSCEVGGNRIYPHRPDLYDKRFWLCLGCGAYCGSHPGTCRPLGSPAGAETRKARSAAHAAFDPRWRGKGNRERSDAYRWLACKLGMAADRCHIGMMSAADAWRVVAACREPK